MATPLEEAYSKQAELRKQQTAIWDKIHALESKWRGPVDEALKLGQEADRVQEEHLETIGMPPKPTKAFLAALAASVGTEACNIEEMRERGNSSRYDRPVAEKIYTKIRDEIPEVAEAVAMRARATAMREEAEKVEKEIRASEEYNALRRQASDLNWPIRMAGEEVERCRKNEEAKERRLEVKADPGLKQIKATREKLNAILAGTATFTWKPQ